MLRWTGLTALIFGGDSRSRTIVDIDQELRQARMRTQPDLTNTVYEALQAQQSDYQEQDSFIPLPDNPPF